MMPLEWGLPERSEPQIHEFEEESCAPDTWWEQYVESIRNEFSQASIDEIDQSTERLAQLELDPSTRADVGTHSVVGDVQSGKTAHMCGLIAKAMDLGYHLVIVLTANSNALRNQTAARINRQILRKADGVDDGQGRMVWSGQQPGHPFSYDRNLATNPSFGFLPCTKKGAASLPSSVDANEARMYLERTLQSVKSGDHKHAILVVKKETNNLAALREALEDTFGGGRTGRPNRRNEFSLVVIDDEQGNASSLMSKFCFGHDLVICKPQEAFYCYHGYPDRARVGFEPHVGTRRPRNPCIHQPSRRAANPFHSRQMRCCGTGDDATIAWPIPRLPSMDNGIVEAACSTTRTPARGMNGSTSGLPPTSTRMLRIHTGLCHPPPPRTKRPC